MKGGCVLGFVASKVFSVIWSVLELVVSFIAKIAVYFGLYLPIINLILGGVLYLVYDFNPFGGGIDGNLYVFGLSLSLVGSVIITIRNLIIKPIQKYFIDGKVIEYTGKIRRGAPEAPKIYKSRVNPGITVYEYENRYDLYEETADGLEKVSTQYKDGKGKR
ncbi:MAG: hypothetical protein ACI4QU_02805 [Christensenellales bacterium]